MSHSRGVQCRGDMQCSGGYSAVQGCPAVSSNARASYNTGESRTAGGSTVTVVFSSTGVTCGLVESSSVGETCSDGVLGQL